MKFTVALAISLLLVAGCGLMLDSESLEWIEPDAGGNHVDASALSDASANVDVGFLDASEPADASEPTDTGRPDSGPGLDASVHVDSGPGPDAAIVVDASVSPDAAAPGLDASEPGLDATVPVDSGTPVPTLNATKLSGAATTLTNTPNVVVKLQVDVVDMQAPLSCMKFSYIFAGTGQITGTAFFWDATQFNGSAASGLVTIPISPQRIVVPGTPVSCILELDIGGAGPGSSLTVTQVWDPACAVGSIEGSWAVTNTLVY
jgi:hypothetical protein